MPWPIPPASAIFERCASVLETGFLRIYSWLDPVALSRAVRSEKGNLSQIGRVFSLETREVHDHVAYWGRQYFVDSAEEEMILRHAGIWDIEQRAATVSLGSVLIEGVAGTSLPADLELSLSTGQKFLTSATAEIGVGGTVSVAARAVLAGAAGNVETGIRLVTVEPYPEISRITIEAPGFAGGTDEETYTDLQMAVIAHIRQRPHGGAGFDYPTWLGRRFSVKAVKPETGWIGRGSVGVIVAMKNTDGTVRAPTELELEAMLEYLGRPSTNEGLRPVTANIVMVACEFQEIPITIRLRPDNETNRAAVSSAFARFVATIGDADDPQNASPIGARIEPSRISEAISAAAGEYAHDRVVPADPYTLGNKKYPIPGTITFLDAL